MRLKLSRKVLILLALLSISLLFSFIFVSAQERKLEVKYPEIRGIKPETVKTGLPEYAAYIFNLVIISLGLVALAALIWAGFLYLISAGNPAKQKEAREQMSAAFLGITIILASYLLLTTISPELTIFKQIEQKIAEVKCTEDEDCGQGYECIQGRCVRRVECSADNECAPGYFCDIKEGQTKGQCVRKTEYSLISLEIPLGRMIDSGIWAEDITTSTKILLEEFEAFLKRNFEIDGQQFNRISNLNKTLKSLTDLCDCDATDSHCAPPQNKGVGIGCTGNPCKDYKEKIDKIKEMNEKIIKNTEETEKEFDGKIYKIDKIDSLIEFKEQLMGTYRVLRWQEDRFLTAYDRLTECLERGPIMTLNQYLTTVELIEAQGGKTKLVQIFPTISSSAVATLPGTTTIQYTVRLKSYWPGAGKVNGVDQGSGSSRGKRVITVRDFLEDPVKYPYVSIAIPLQLYKPEGPFEYGDIVEIPELAKDLAQKYGVPNALFIVMDTGPALTNYYKNSGGRDIVVDIPTYRWAGGKPAQKPVPNVDKDGVTLIKLGKNVPIAPLTSAADPLTFYCPIGGTAVEWPSRQEVPPEIYEKPTDLTVETAPIKPLYCPAYLPVGELIDSVSLEAFQVNGEIGRLISYTDLLISALKEMNKLVSDCRAQNCTPNCGYGPNPCYRGLYTICTPILFPPLDICCNPKSLPPCLPCPKFRLPSPGLQTGGSCIGNKASPFLGSPCPKDNIEKLAGSTTNPENQGKIKEYEDAILEEIKNLKARLAEQPFVWKMPIGDANLLEGVRAGANFCSSQAAQERIEELSWVMLNCSLAVGNNGPDNKEISDCHPQSFFCCTNDWGKARLAKSKLPPATTRGATSYRIPDPAEGYGKSEIVNNCPERGKCLCPKGWKCLPGVEIGNGGHQYEKDAAPPLQNLITCMGDKLQNMKAKLNGKEVKVMDHVQISSISDWRLYQSAQGGRCYWNIDKKPVCCVHGRIAGNRCGANGFMSWHYGGRKCWMNQKSYAVDIDLIPKWPENQDLGRKVEKAAKECSQNRAHTLFGVKNHFGHVHVSVKPPVSGRCD